MNNKGTFYPETRFGGFTDVDGTVAFFTRVASLVDSSSVVLDVGCGRGAFHDDPVPVRKNLRRQKGRVARVIGIDVDPGARENPCLDEFRLIDGATWPIEDEFIDLIVCDNVVEHIDDPDQFFREAKRVLRHAGYLCIRTPNRRNYISLISRLVPNKYHSRVTHVVQDGREEEDVFPTLYRCNTRGKLRRLMARNGFDCVVYGYEAEPSYLSFSRVAYFMGVLHQRFAPRFLKAAIFAFGQVTKDIGSQGDARPQSEAYS